MRFKKAVKDATREVRKKQSEIVAVAQQGLGSVRSVSAFGPPGPRSLADERGEPRDRHLPRSRPAA
jgi:hypothetical protein